MDGHLPWEGRESSNMLFLAGTGVIWLDSSLKYKYLQILLDSIWETKQPCNPPPLIYILYKSACPLSPPPPCLQSGRSCRPESSASPGLPALGPCSHWSARSHPQTSSPADENKDISTVTAHANSITSCDTLFAKHSQWFISCRMSPCPLDPASNTSIRPGFHGKSW